MIRRTILAIAVVTGLAFGLAAPANAAQPSRPGCNAHSAAHNKHCKRFPDLRSYLSWVRNDSGIVRVSGLEWSK